MNLGIRLELRFAWYLNTLLIITDSFKNEEKNIFFVKFLEKPSIFMLYLHCSINTVHHIKYTQTTDRL